MTKTLSAILYLLFYFYITTINANEINSLNNWEKIKNVNGVSVYSMKNEKSDIIKVKVHVVINAPIKRIQYILDDIAHRDVWIPLLHHSNILLTLSNTEKIEYSLFSALWPVSDRDFVYRISQIRSDNNQIIYSMKSEKNSLMPINDDIIRADLIESIYTLTALNKKQTNVELIYHADPKGWLPYWVINIIQKILPYMMLRNLREQAQIN